MAEATDIYGGAFKNGSATVLGRIVGADAAAIVKADISTITYSIYLLDDQDADSRTAVTNHSAVSLTVSAVVFDSLQTDAIWTVDSTGYNFKHVLDVSSDVAFAIAGRRYLVEYTLTPDSGQVILVRARVNVI